jgi:hypothetical protein
MSAYGVVQSRRARGLKVGPSVPDAAAMSRANPEAPKPVSFARGCVYILFVGVGRAPPRVFRCDGARTRDFSARIGRKQRRRGQLRSTVGLSHGIGTDTDLAVDVMVSKASMGRQPIARRSIRPPRTVATHRQALCKAPPGRPTSARSLVRAAVRWC